jgi:adenine-specific DNA-methyltransferase
MPVSFSQYMTPPWAAERLVELFFPHLSAQDVVLEPSCGKGAFLQAIPGHVPAYGVEIDPFEAQEAREFTGRKIVEGDFRTVKLPERPTVIIGNPPYKAELLGEFLERSKRLLKDGEQVGFLLSIHLLQTPSAVIRWNEDWSLSQHLVPRTLFPRAIRPLSFVVYTKDKRRQLVGGFSLFHESNDVQEMSREVQSLLRTMTSTPVWRTTVGSALQELGGEAKVQDIYKVIEPKRPSGNPWWQEKIRQTLQLHFRRVSRGVWALPV